MERSDASDWNPEGVRTESAWTPNASRAGALHSHIHSHIQTPRLLFIHDLTVTRATLPALPLGVMDERLRRESRWSLMGGWNGSWHPEGIAREYGRRRPTVGDLVAYDYRAWEVTHLRVDDFTSDEQERADGYRAEFRDELRPWSVSLRRVHGKPHPRENSRQEIALRVAAFTYGGFDRYKDGRVPLCSCHSEPWPCIDAVQQAQAALELKAAEKELARMPGSCPACDEPVTSRQQSITFGGPNVRNPLAEGPTFHLRAKCRHAAARYEEAWVTAEPGRQRSLLTLSCEGTVIVHGDGSGECFGAVDSDCPSIYAKHRGYMSCYIQSHGCGRGCSSQGHPGTRLAGQPVDPRAVWS